MIRNLIYFITPKGNWRWNLSLLKQYESVFTGKKYAMLAVGPGLMTYPESKSYVAELDIFDEILATPNDPDKRETPGLSELLSLAQTQEGITFFAHTKGVTRRDDEAVEKWTQACYDKNLSDIPAVESALKDYCTVGCFRRKGHWPHLKPLYKWHYSGTFWWLNNSKLISGEWIKALRKHKYGAEEFIGNLVPYEHSYCLFGDNCGDLYNLNYIKRLLG